MALVDYLGSATICMDLRAQGRDEAVRFLLGLLAADGKLPANLLDRAVLAVLERERLGSTAIGRGVAVPHAQLDELDGVLIAFGHSVQGVDFHALDAAPVHEIFLIMAPQQCRDEYVEALGRVSRLVQNDDFRRFLSQADRSTAVLELIEEMDA
jgi:PTS system fructose-specific IIA component/PTS system nitrogen regulatory IIA component